MKPLFNRIDLLAIVCTLVFVRLLAIRSSFFLRRQCNDILYAEEPTLIKTLLCSTFLLEVLGAVSVLVLMRVVPCMLHAGPSMLRKRSSRKAKKKMVATQSNDRYLLEDQHIDASNAPSRFDDLDIFLSHSGQQKGFASELYSMLHSMGYTVFFDVTHLSLPLHIFRAAATCKLAVLVLSHDFLISKRPMAELCALVEKESTLKFLPIFYKLSPGELKLKENLQRWRKRWRALAKQDPGHVDAAKCEHSLQVLGKFNGVVFDPVNGGELSYVQKILSIISEIVKPMIKYDMPGVEGKDRLTKILISKFEELELSTAHTSSFVSGKVCVLCMYGLPGSGKSTLSKCLCNYYAHPFNGRVLYLQLPASPTEEQLVEVSKQLLENATNMYNRVHLKDVTKLGQVYHLLESYLQSFSVFLVVDNINIMHRQPIITEFVQRILTCHFQPGSKVLLVARSLHPFQWLGSCDDIQKKYTQGKGKYAFDSVSVPTINRREATEILMKSAREWFSDSGAQGDELDQNEQQIVEDAISRSSFGNNQYLPLVIKIMGAQLGRTSDYSNWGLDMERFWKKVQECKENALMRLVKETFDTLPQRLQLLFLDVALFVLQHPLYHHRGATSILSIMHEVSPERIEMDMVSLQRHCFFEHVEPTSIIIHDVFLEFAANCPESCMYYASTVHGVLNLPPSEQQLLPPAELAKNLGLRAVVLELDERHKHFDFWEGFSSVKVLVLRNCASQTVLRLPVSLLSLVILEIRNCPNLILKATKGFNFNSLKCLIWENKSTRNRQKRRNLSMPLQILPHMGGGNELGLKMRWLQELRLAHTGIKRLQDLSKCWPLLRSLNILETCLEHFELGNLVCLEYFAFTGGVIVDKFLLDKKPADWPIMKLQSMTDLISGSQRSRFVGKDLLIGCPNLKSVSVLAACVEDGLDTVISSKLHNLHLGSCWYAKSFPDLAAATRSLRTVMAWDCRQLIDVSFMHRFEVLKEVHLVCCPRLFQVTGLDRLYSLCDLRISRCEDLQTVSGLSGLTSLQSFQLQDCGSLRTLSGVRDLVSLVKFDVGNGCPELEILHSDLQNLTKLVDLYYNQHTFQPGVLKLSNLLRLKYLTMVFNKGAHNSGMSVSLENLANLRVLKLTSDEKMENSYDMAEVHVDFATLLGVSHLSNLVSISRVAIKGVHNLENLRGIGFLLQLKTLSLMNLGSLSCLQGIEDLLGLETLIVNGCDSIEELPSLSPLVNLKNLNLKNCSKLKDLDGCDALEQLQFLKLIGCQGMGCFPLSDAAVSRLKWLSIEGSKFASINALVAWAVRPDDKKGSLHIGVLRIASTRALEWELRHNFCDGKARMNLAKIVLERVRVLSRLIPSNDECFNFSAREGEKLPTYSLGEEVSFPVELLRGLETQTERCPKMECCQFDARFRDLLISYLAEAPPSVLETNIFNCLKCREDHGYAFDDDGEDDDAEGYDETDS